MLKAKVSANNTEVVNGVIVVDYIVVLSFDNKLVAIVRIYSEDVSVETFI